MLFFCRAPLWILGKEVGMVFVDASSLKQKKNNDIIMYQLGSRQTDKMSLFLCIYLKLAQAIRIKVTLQYKVINPSFLFFIFWLNIIHKVFMCAYGSSQSFDPILRINIFFNFSVKFGHILDYDCLTMASGRFVVMVVGLIGMDAMSVFFTDLCWHW